MQLWGRIVRSGGGLCVRCQTVGVGAATDEFQDELLRTELTRLASNGLDWPHARSQCVLAYFKLSVVYQLDYDTEFCSVRNPNNIWSLIQRVQNSLVTEQEDQSEAMRQALQSKIWKQWKFRRR
uniref:Uncharacterized protein n=1 Tax=Ditylenchus dipsaci TaxID=166011 RepID=A0A915DPT1_9BILA